MHSVPGEIGCPGRNSEHGDTGGVRLFGRRHPTSVGCVSLLTREEISIAVHAHAQPGALTPAMDETDTRICSLQVSGQLGTVLAYLGEGDAPTNTDLYQETEVRGHTYVIVWAQGQPRTFRVRRPVSH